MPLVEVFKCDSCKKIIEQPRDVYRIELKGENWKQSCPAGGRSETMQNIKQLGFCEPCARNIVYSLEKIACKK